MKMRYILTFLLLAMMATHSFVVAEESQGAPLSTAARSELKRLRAENAMLRVQILSLRKENKALRKEIKSLKAPATQPTTQPTTKPAPGKVAVGEIEIYAKTIKQLGRKVPTKLLKRRYRNIYAKREAVAEWMIDNFPKKRVELKLLLRTRKHVRCHYAVESFRLKGDTPMGCNIQVYFRDGEREKIDIGRGPKAVVIRGDISDVREAGRGHTITLVIENCIVIAK